MKNQIFVTTLMAMAMVIISSFSFAQNRQNDYRGNQREVKSTPDDGIYRGPCANIPNLTDDQQKAIDELRTEHLNKTNMLRAQIQEKQAHLKTLRLADKPDMDKIGSTIDEISVFRSDLMKEREAHIQAVRSKLDADQKAWFDSRPQRGPGENRAFRGGGPCRYNQDNERPEGRRRYRQFR